MSADNQNQNPFESEIETNGRMPSPPVHAEGNSDGDIAHAEPSDPEKDDSAIAQDKGKMRESNTEPSELEKGALNKETGATEKATSPSPTNDGEKPEAKHVEGEAKPTLFTRVKRHLRKYWYWYLIADVIILAIVLPIVFTKGLPAISQMLVNKSKITVFSVGVRQPNATHIAFSLAFNFAVNFKLPIRSDSAQLNLFVPQAGKKGSEITPFLSLQLPTFDLQRGSGNCTVVDQIIPIADMDSWVYFLNETVNERSFDVGLYAKLHVHPGHGLSSKPTLDKPITFQGLRHFQGWYLSSIGLNVDGSNKTENLKGTAMLPNYGVGTYVIGNHTMKVTTGSGSLELGEVVLPDLQLSPGNNSCPLIGTLDISKLLSNWKTVFAQERDAILAGKLRLQTTGLSTIYNGVQLEWYQKVLTPLVLTTEVPLSKLLSSTAQNVLMGKPNLLRDLTMVMNT